MLSSVRSTLTLFRLEAAASPCCHLYHVISLPTLFHRLTARHDRPSVDLSSHPKSDKEPLSKLSDLASRILVLSFFQRRIHRTFSSLWTQWQDQISPQHNQLGKRLRTRTRQCDCHADERQNQCKDLQGHAFTLLFVSWPAVFPCLNSFPSRLRNAATLTSSSIIESMRTLPKRA